jgi:hypothetical protein
MDDGRVRTLIAIFRHHEQILAPLAIPEADDGEVSHIHREASPMPIGKPRSPEVLP